MEQQPFSFNGTTYNVTISLGVAVTMPGEQLPSAQLIANADKNLYKAKLGGRNCVFG